MEQSTIESRELISNEPSNEGIAAKNLLDCVHDCMSANANNRVGKVTGIGGVFFKSHVDQQVLRDWYEENLGLKIDKNIGVAKLMWSDDKAEDGGVTAWEPSAKTEEWFSPGKPEFMINYRVDNIQAIHERLKKNNANIVQGPESYENGKFLWVLDPAGNKVELWEPRLWDEKNKQP